MSAKDGMRMKLREITEADNNTLAEIVRKNLKKHGLDLPGTVYFDENLYHLSDFYLGDKAKRFYYIVSNDSGGIIGGIGLAEFEFFENCAELQKLYLTDEAKGSGLGYKLIDAIEDKARELGYKKIYLETHTNLAAAIHIYEKCGYRKIQKPEEVVHATMNRFYIRDL